jgi:L-fuconolactonase
VKIDAHQHVWRLARGDYGWLTPALAPLYRDFTLDDLRPHLARAGIAGTVLVQAAPTEAETRFMLDVARESAGLVKAVVGWVDMMAPDAPVRLAALAADPQLRGIRPMIQDIADPEWMLDRRLDPAFRAIRELGLCFDALVKPVHLTPLRRLLERHPELPVVIDHGAKPPIAAGVRQPWADDIAAIARDTRALCKLSGLVTESRPGWGIDDLRPYVDHLLAWFGPSRLIWGSDWPVVNLAGGYDRWREVTDTVLSGLSAEDRARIDGANAAAFYRWI